MRVKTHDEELLTFQSKKGRNCAHLPCRRTNEDPIRVVAGRLIKGRESKLGRRFWCFLQVSCFSPHRLVACSLVQSHIISGPKWSFHLDSSWRSSWKIFISELRIQMTMWDSVFDLPCDRGGATDPLWTSHDVQRLTICGHQARVGLLQEALESVFLFLEKQDRPAERKWAFRKGRNKTAWKFWKSHARELTLSSPATSLQDRGRGG